MYQIQTCSVYKRGRAQPAADAGGGENPPLLGGGEVPPEVPGGGGIPPALGGGGDPPAAGGGDAPGPDVGATAHSGCTFCIRISWTLHCFFWLGLEFYYAFGLTLLLCGVERYLRPSPLEGLTTSFCDARLVTCKAVPFDRCCQESLLMPQQKFARSETSCEYWCKPACWCNWREAWDWRGWHRGHICARWNGDA